MMIKHMVKKIDHTFNRFNTIPACCRRTDGQLSTHGIVCVDAKHRAVKMLQ